MKFRTFRLLAVTALPALVALQGCATKNYGRQGEFTSFEQSTMTCREIELEEAKVRGFIQHVESESGFDGRSVLSFMGDFGIGNTLEKSSALDSANKRLASLEAARQSRRCAAGG
ncbi:hypothetical protein GN316_04990 [Xylophilus sp. Kf1]|nr:hypothetical protein [Xylophilus sp. Kf1]